MTRRYGKYLLITEADVRNAQGWFDRHGKAVVFFGRMIPAIRSLISIPAGMHHMAMLPFLALTALGSLIWSSMLAYEGYKLGANYDRVSEFIAPISTVVVLVVMLLLAYFVTKRIKTVFFDRPS